MYHSLDIKKVQSGRTLLETLAVLVIFAVITVLSVLCYKKITNRVEADTITESILKHVVQRRHEALTKKGFIENLVTKDGPHGVQFEIKNDIANHQIIITTKMGNDDLKNALMSNKNLKAQASSITSGGRSGNYPVSVVTKFDQFQKVLNCNYTTTEYVEWTQPVLSSNGTMGGSSFACNASSTIGFPRYAWRAFDGSNSNSEIDCWHGMNGTTGWLSWYNPTPIAVKKITVTNRSTQGASNYYVEAIKNYQVQYSDNNSSWTTVVSCTNTATTQKESSSCTVDADSSHKYWRLKITSGWRSYLVIGELTIEATERITYTYHEDATTHKCVKDT